MISSKRFLNSNQDLKVLIMVLFINIKEIFWIKADCKTSFLIILYLRFFTIPILKLQNLINFFIKESALKGRVHNQLGLVSKKGNGSSNEQTKYISPFVQKFWGKSVNKKVKNIAFLTKKAFLYWITFSRMKKGIIIFGQHLKVIMEEKELEIQICQD